MVTSYPLSDIGYDFSNAFLLASLPRSFVTCRDVKITVTSSSPLEPAALPAVLAQIAAKHQSFTDRVLARLSEAEREEVNTHLQQDIRQAWITVSYAQRMSDAFVMASYAIYGKHPDHILPSIVADRKERLGAEYYEWYSADDLLRPDVPKIPVVKVADAMSTAGVGASIALGREKLAPPVSKIPPTTTANADTHAAHESRMPVSGTTESGSVPNHKEVV